MSHKYNWTVTSNNTALYGYGACVRVSTNGRISLGRIYTTSGDFGGWGMEHFSDVWVNFNNVIVEES